MNHPPPASPVWITGAGGLIGHQLVRAAPRFAGGSPVIGLARADLDLTDFAAVRERFLADRPGGVIHCAAMSKGPACQANPALAHQVNVDATRHLAELAADIPMIFFSTDLVFDGRKGNYAETDPVNPLGVYAGTKVAAEKIVLENPRHTVLRTSLNYGHSPGTSRSFNDDLLDMWRQGKVANLFVDEFRSPIGVEVTARATWELLQLGRSGLFHLAGSERLSRLDIGRLIAARHAELHPQIKPGLLREYAGGARPPDTTLDCAKLQSALSFELPKFSEWLRQSSPA